ncbi:hypothetical protein B0A49_09574, partial [Cryomyces minteri]
MSGVGVAMTWLRESEKRQKSERLPRGKEKLNGYGSAVGRSLRNKRAKGLTPVVVPNWFLERNVKLREDNLSPGPESLDVNLLRVIEKGTGATYATVPIPAELLKAWDGVGGVSGFVASLAQQSNQRSKRDGAHEFPHDDVERITTLVCNAIADQAQVRRAELYVSPWVEVEVKASIAASLSLANAELRPSFAAAKSNLTIHCPVNGGTKVLDKLMEGIAADVAADLIVVDAQDIAELAHDYISESSDPSLDSIGTLGYDTYHYLDFDSRIKDEEEDDWDEQDEDADDAMSGEEISGRSHGTIGLGGSRAVPIGTIASISGIDDIKSFSTRLSNAISGKGGRTNGEPSFFGRSPAQSSSSMQWDDLKLSALLETLLETNQTKRESNSWEPTTSPTGFSIETQHSSSTKGQPATDSAHPRDYSTLEAEAFVQLMHSLHMMKQNSNMTMELDVPPITGSGSLDSTLKPQRSARTILLVRDIKEISATRQGGLILQKLVEIVYKKRRDGESIMMVGTSSNADLVPEISRSGIRLLQSEGEGSFSRTIVVPIREGERSPSIDATDQSGAGENHEPVEALPEEALPGNLLDAAEATRIEEINLRHIQTMMRRLAPNARTITEMNQPLSLPALGSPGKPSLREYVLSFGEVHKLSLAAIGIQSELTWSEECEPIHISIAMALLQKSDKEKLTWALEHRVEQLEPLKPTSDLAKPSKWEKRLNQLEKTATKYEKRLLGGVVNPHSISTTFTDVHAPPETIEALRTLTSLSLTRPDAFKYGVLATDKIPGLLLYGPPGTGKTMLAKAVAKQSGATMLEVSGSEVYDMYVGEGEKNVKAIFTLSKKLSPCVVFIDEADAIFGSRSGPGNRNTHREIINQFLKEWDGMNDLSVFIMVATNRPFDLDDAVLRRLPRRLLVDLPVEKDREAILKIHLSGEQAPGVSLSKLAEQTPLYSGSDLKNLCVAAALAAVREENVLLTEHQDEEDFKLPEKRVLTIRHFDKAMEEISASISEDMSSLGAIRKFDERFGDRKGRKKKSGWGFSTLEKEGIDEGAAR